MFNRLGWLSVNQLVFFHTVMAVYKMRQTMEPEYLAKKMMNDNFRGGLVVPATNLTLAKDSFCFRGGDYWISLPETLRNLKNVFENLYKHENSSIPELEQVSSY